MLRRRRDRSAQLIREAMRHVDAPGAGAQKRRKLGLTGREKASVVMKEFARGTLRHGSTGEVVTDPQVAKAIAMSEGRKAESGWMGSFRRRRSHHSPYAVVYGGQAFGLMRPSSWSSEQALNRELQLRSAHLWDRDIGSLDEAIEEAMVASRRHRAKVVVYDEHTGEDLYTQDAPEPRPEPRRHESMARTSEPIDAHAVTELRLYAENESTIYPMHQAIVASLKKKMAKGTYDATKAPLAWAHWVEVAARKYVKEFGGNLTVTFPPAVRHAVAAEIAHDEGERIKAGEYGPVASKPAKGHGSDAWRMGPSKRR